MKNSALNENGFGFACFAYLSHTSIFKEIADGGGWVNP